MISNRDRWFYELALRLAEDSECKDKHGSVLVKSGRVLSVATNRESGSPAAAQFEKQETHAEQRAILRAREPLGSTIYSARYHDNPISAPCVLCLFLIERAGVRTVVYHDGVQLRKRRV